MNKLVKRNNSSKTEDGNYTLHYHGIFLQCVLQPLHYQPFCEKFALSLEIYVRRIDNYNPFSFHTLRSGRREYYFGTSYLVKFMP